MRAPLGRGWGWRLRDTLSGTSPRAGVLLYHRIAAVDDDPRGLAVSPAAFERQLAVLRRVADVIPAEELVEAVRARRPPHGAVAVTFDDGYADNLHAAAPIATAAGIPITIFVVSDPILNGRPFWWERLWRITAGRLTTSEPARGDVLPGPARLSRYRMLQRRLDGLDLEERDAFLKEAEAGHKDGLGDARPLTADELRRLAAQPNVTIGAHSVTHPALARVDAQRERRELEGSRDGLERALGREVRLLAYPFGQPADVSDRTVAASADAGYRGAFTSVGGVVMGRTEAFRIPRLTIHERDTDRFERLLASAFGLRPPRTGRRRPAGDRSAR